MFFCSSFQSFFIASGLTSNWRNKLARKRFLRRLFLVIKDTLRHCFRIQFVVLYVPLWGRFTIRLSLNTLSLSPMPLPFPLPPYRLPLSTPGTHVRLPGLSCWFSHYVIKNQTKELSSLLTFYFGEVLEQLKNNIYTHFHFERVFWL